MQLKNTVIPIEKRITKTKNVKKSRPAYQFILFLAIVCSAAIGCNRNPVGSFDYKGWQKPAANPILSADSNSRFFDPVTQQDVYWEKADVFNPAAILHQGKVAMLYRAEDNKAAGIGGRTSRIGLAFSANGQDFERYGKPVLFPDRDSFFTYEYPGGCEDPRIVAHPKGGYLMTYTAWNGRTARLSIAESTNLTEWKKHGPAFRAAGSKWLNTWSKSGSIVCQWVNKQPVPVVLKGKYWMYWGDTKIYAATSDNLIDWTPYVDDFGNLIPVLAPRKRRFDSGLVEPGPPAILTSNGVELIYNGKNEDDRELSDTDLPPGTYSAGLAIFEPAYPILPLGRSMAPFLRPTLPHEVMGQYKSGTTFAQAIVPFNGKWWLYYGTADSYVGLAVVKK